MATSILPVDPPVIRAAGGILQRYTPQGDEVMIVYRKRHQDWTLPKGKVKDGESFQEAAMREVEEETGCSCRAGNYLGTISYADKGVPKVVLFWKMSLVAEKGVTDSAEIGEALWMPVPAAIQRLTYAQEKALLTRIGSAPRLPQPQLAPPPQAEPAQAEPPQEASEPLVQHSRRHKNSSMEDNRAHSRLLRESEAFRVELAFLGRRSEDRRSEQSDNSWAAAAQDQLQNVKRCLESNDIEGGWFCFHAAQRFAVFGLNKAELANRAHILREEAQKITSWRSATIASLLAVGDDQLTAERVADAMALRNEDSTNHYYRTRLTGDQLRILLIICGLSAVALLPFMLLSGHIPVVAAAMLFGLIGAAFCSAQSLILGKNESRIPNIFVTLTPVLFGAVAGLAGFAVYEYLAITFNIAQQHVSAILALAFLFGCMGQRVLARIAAPHKEHTRVSASG